MVKSFSSGAQDNLIKMWNARVVLGENVRTLTTFTDGVSAVAPDGLFIASGLDNNLITLWDVTNDSLLRAACCRYGTHK